MTTRQQQAMSIFVREKYSITGAAAIVGALTGESGVNLNSTVFRTHADHDSGGIAEWRLDRKTAMISFVRSLGRQQEDLEGQCLFIINELERDYAALNSELHFGVKTIITMCWNFVQLFERPNMAVAHMDDVRVPAAIRCYNDYMAANHQTVPPIAKGGVVIGTAAGSGAIATVGQVPPLATIIMAVLSGLSYLVTAINVKSAPKPLPMPIPEQPGPIVHIQTMPVSPLDNYISKLEKLQSAQIEADAARKDLVSYVDKERAVLDSIDLKIIDHVPLSQPQV